MSKINKKVNFHEFLENKIESFNLPRETKLSKLKKWTNLKIGKKFEKWTKIENWTKIESWTKIDKN